MSSKMVSGVVDGGYAGYAVCVAALLFGVLMTFSRRSTNWIRVGGAPGLFGLNKKAASTYFGLHGRTLLQEAYKTHKDKNFVVQTVVRGDVLILAPKFMNEARMFPEEKLSHAEMFIDYMVGEHIGATMAMEGSQHANAVRGPLTQSLKSQVPVMLREYRRISEILFSAVPKDTNEICAYQFGLGLVSAITSTICLGEELTHGGGWDNIAFGFYPIAWGIRCALKPWPRALRPIVKHIIVRDECRQLEALMQEAENFLKEPVERRRDPNNQDNDLLKFLSAHDESSPRKIAMQVTGVITGAWTTSANNVAQAIYDLCAHPEYLAEIRAEVLDALASKGGQWSYGVIKKLHLLDAFLKESMRLFAPEGMALTRLATSSFALSDGTWIPKGTSVAVAGEAWALDPNFYPDPTTFNPRRFLDPATGKPLSPEREFSGIEPGNAMWGAGRLTCPGRHYASAMLKLIIANLVLKYDVRLPAGQTEPPALIHDDGNAAPSKTQMVVLVDL